MMMMMVVVMMMVTITVSDTSISLPSDCLIEKCIEAFVRIAITEEIGVAGLEEVHLITPPGLCVVDTVHSGTPDKVASERVFKIMG